MASLLMLSHLQHGCILLIVQLQRMLRADTQLHKSVLMDASLQVAEVHLNTAVVLMSAGQGSRLSCPEVHCNNASASPHLEACKACAFIAAFCSAHKLPFAGDHLLLRAPPHANLAFLHRAMHVVLMQNDSPKTAKYCASVR